MNALKAAELETVPGSESDVHPARVLRLPPDVRIPQFNNAPLFVRWFSMACLDSVMTKLDPTASAQYRKFIVLGNAGSKCHSC